VVGKEFHRRPGNDANVGCSAHQTRRTPGLLHKFFRQLLPSSPEEAMARGIAGHEMDMAKKALLPPWPGEAGAGAGEADKGMGCSGFWSSAKGARNWRVLWRARELRREPSGPVHEVRL